MANPTAHKFRYLLKPGTDFQFVAQFRTWVTRLLFDWYISRKRGELATISI